MRVTNCYATAELNRKFDMRDVCRALNNCEVSKMEGPVRIRLKNPRCFVTVSAHGRATVLGNRSTEDARKALKKVARRLHLFFDRVRFTDFRVRNMHGVHKLGVPLNLLAMSNHFHGGGSNFASDIWGDGVPCVKVPIRDISRVDSDVVVRVHSTGTLNLASARSEDDLKQALELLVPAIAEFQCETLEGVGPQKSTRALKRDGASKLGQRAMLEEDDALLEAASDFDSDENNFMNDSE